ncbi:uncharacterized protein N7483_007579 [Penicillium malachiteum]|uniref:uncharacterized protein n=1 Tax=Penicillium malachiteum TaxID=1324776 RepID=UPI002546F139|nr:uncharacterized protein N7483_007579 [Penicillium malachiteum]KAJ5726222.1 hypothetical protein N7483_007579 [Penicillium malachiteum]
MEKIQDSEEVPAPAKDIKRHRLEKPQDPTPDPIHPPWLWSTEEVGYFYPDYNADTEHFRVKGSNQSHATVFYNAEAFVSHLRGLIVFQPAQTIQTNIHLCLRDDALDWYNTELSDAERKDLRDLPMEHKNGWFNQILNRFRISPIMTSSYLSSHVSGKTICASARNIVRYAKAAGIHDTHRHLLQIWEYLENNHPNHARCLFRPSEDTSLSEFMRKLYVVEQEVVITSDDDSDENYDEDEDLQEPPMGFQGCDNCDCKCCKRTRY